MLSLNDSFSAVVIQFLNRHPFYGNLLLEMRVEFNNTVQTAGVYITDRPNLVINPNFWGKLDYKGRYAVLEHEIGHLNNNHHSRSLDLEPSLGEKNENIVDRINKSWTHSRLNIAMDAAINEWIPNLPKIPILDKNGEFEKDEDGKDLYGDAVKVDLLKNKYKGLENNREFEYYYKVLDDDFQENAECMMIGDHTIWVKGETNKEVVNEVIKNTMNKAAGCTGIGNMTSSDLEVLSKINKSDKNWKRELAMFFSNQLEYFLESTRSKRNRRYGLKFPGYRKESKLKIAIAVDISGSNSTEYISQFFSEIDRIHSNGIQIIVIQADCEVKDVREYKPKDEITLKGRGGTDYSPAIEKAKDLEVDGLIYFGDMEIYSDNLVKPTFPVLWAGTEGSNKPVDWGKFIEVKLKTI